MTDKYVNKKWVDTNMKYDPMYLFENKKSRFDKFVARVYGDANEDSKEEEEEAAPAPARKKKEGKNNLFVAPAKPAPAKAAPMIS